VKFEHIVRYNYSKRFSEFLETFFAARKEEKFKTTLKYITKKSALYLEFFLPWGERDYIL